MDTGGTARIASRRPFATARPPFEAIDREQHKEREEKQNDANRGRFRGAKIIEPGDDLQRRDLRLARNISGYEDHRTIFADRACEGQRQSAEPGWQDLR